jgi:hypothetical protein
MRTFLLPLVAAAFFYTPAPLQAQAFPDGPGKEILEKECSTCHAPDMVRTFGRSPEEWHEVVMTMIDQGAKISDEQVPVLVDYLAKNWPLKGASGASAAPAAPTPAQAPSPAASHAPAATAGAAAGSGTSTNASADIPADYKAVLDTLGRTGDFKDGVLKVNIPRNDLSVSVDGVATPTPFGFGGWVAMEKGTGGMDVMMGDLVLTEAEVNPVMSALLNAGFEVTALHNHFFLETPRIFYMHVHGHGAAADLATKLKPALGLFGKPAASPSATSGAASAGKPISGTLNSAQLAKIVGTEGESNGGVYKITVGRPDIKMVEMGAPINARMGLNTWAAFYGSDTDAVVAGDVAMLEPEVQPVLKALRAGNINVVAMHHHMIGTNPNVIFLHYWGRGPAQALASTVRAAIDQTGKPAR